MIAGRKAATSHRNGTTSRLRGPRAASAGRWAPPRREPRPDGRTSWAAGPVNHARPPRPWLARRGAAAFGGRPDHHHVALDRPVRAHCPAPTTAATAALEERKEGITSQFAGPCMAETTRPGLLVIAEVHARHRVRAGGANNWDLGGECSIMQCRACVDDTWLGVLHCIGS